MQRGPPSGISLASTATTGRSGQQTPESWSKWTHPLIEPIFARRVMKPLPSWTDAFSLVSEFFTHQHQVFPCFNPPVFMSFLGQQYSSPCNESPTWWVSLNAVLAIAQRRRAEEAQAAEAEDLAWGYASNALAGTWDVLMRGTQLSSVQALLAIAWFFIGTPNPQPSFMLVGCAVRLALSIGIHIDSQDPSLSPVDSYMRKKVFWIAICLDRELCLRTGRPPCHDLNAVYVDPPLDAHDETEILVTIAGFQVNLFKAQMQLAVIQGSIYQDLHSNKLPTVLSDSISILQERLSTWCAEFAPSLLDNSVQDCEHHGLMRLYFSYYAAVIVVNRAHSLSYWSSPNHSDISTLSPIVRTSIEACIHASRSIIGLTKLIPGRWKSFHWDVIIPMSAIVLLCINTIRNPVGGIAENDLRSVGDFLHIFKTLDEAYGNTYLTQVRKVCQELYRKAQNALRMDSTEFCHRVNPDCRAAFGGYQDQTNLSQGAGMSNVFDVDLNTFEQAMPYSVPMLWDLDTSLWASLT
ncbi:fungal-specific transcription factor [Fusarium oxysporum f. sp. albedinis]|nr:fungal-specific transcription factor [Fusarium oxysporum f. sp. albedinis]